MCPFDMSSIFFFFLTFSVFLAVPYFLAQNVQVHLVPSLHQPWNLSFLQGHLIPFNKRIVFRNKDLGVGCANCSGGVITSGLLGPFSGQSWEKIKYLLNLNTKSHFRTQLH